MRARRSRLSSALHISSPPATTDFIFCTDPYNAETRPLPPPPQRLAGLSPHTDCTVGQAWTLTLGCSIDRFYLVRCPSPEAMNAHAGTLFPSFWFDGNVALVCRITFQYSERGGRLRYSMSWFGRGQFKRWEIKVESCVYLQCFSRWLLKRVMLNKRL